MALAKEICETIRQVAEENPNKDWNNLSLPLYRRILEVLPEDYISYVIRESTAKGYRYEMELVLPAGKFKYMVM